MGTDSEIFRTANLLIQEYGEMASPAAFIRADQLSDKGDMPGRRIWLHIAKVAENLLSETLPENVSIH